MIIAAALADGVSEVKNINPSEDIDATVDAMVALGAKIVSDGSTYTIKGISTPAEKAVINCRESGSTLRFIIPIAAALGCDTTFYGSGKLPTRPITPYKREMSAKGVSFEHTEGVMPFSVTGKLQGGEYRLEGDVSSQFITGLLYALPLCEEDSRIVLTSVLESKPYADMTVAALKQFGIEIDESVGSEGFPVYTVKGNQRYKPADCTVEGDYSQAAFFFAANALGSELVITNLNENSVQGDKKILEILQKMCYNEKECGNYDPFTVDAADIPDIVPILTVLGCFTSSVSRIVNAKRLKIKESDRLKAIADALNAIGGKVSYGDDYLEITPVKGFHGGFVNGCNDHRIVMASAIASTMSDGAVTISDCGAVAKSYPDFWQDFKSLGGNIEFFD
jgi:3-phosphoshikimate 1-carboxyvinyltransferase